jgi:two-component system phosphate regulon sensor histidine kinase PhoR
MAADLHTTLQRLEAESRRVGTIVASMAEGLVVLDPRGKISVLNPAAEALLGITAAAALGQRPLEVVRSHELDDLVKAAAGQETPATAELTLARPIRRILGGSAVAMRDAAGSILGTILVLRDVTQLKRLEDIRMEFVLNVSHELRTPLTAIRGYVETLLDGALDDREEARTFLGVIQRHAERLGRLLNDLLDLSNLELERVTPTLRPLAVSEALQPAVAVVTPQAEQKGLRLRQTIPPGVPAVLADRDRLVQILVNLLDNAVKYTPEGGEVHARVSHGPVHPSLAAGTGWRDMVEICIEDTGMGIPAKDLPRITERFYRVDKARSRDLGGTGLGLAIVKHLVQAHRGLLSIESDLGTGTRVRVFLPPAPVA